MTNEKKMSPAEVIHWLEVCGSNDCYDEQFHSCPYRFCDLPHEDGCGKLARYGAELLRAAYGAEGGGEDGQAEAAE